MRSYHGEDILKLLTEQLENIYKNRIISGVGDGEKVILSQKFDRLLFLCSDFVSAGRIKRGLEGFGKKIEIISASRENNDELDANLLPFSSAINRYLLGNTDGLIFLPSSLLVKFDKEKFSTFDIQKDCSYDLDKLLATLAEYGYERVSLVQEIGQFARRGDILDIYMPIFDNPIRIEFFDDLVEKIYFFDIISMKNTASLDKVSICQCKMPLGENNVFDLDGVKFVDQPLKIQEEIDLLLKSYSILTNFSHENYANFDKMLEKSDYIFDNTQYEKDCYYNDRIASRSYLTDFMALKKDILEYKKLHQSIILFAGNEKHKQNIENFLAENGLTFHDESENRLKREEVYVSSIAMPYTFSFLKERVIGIGADNLFKSTLSTFSKSKHSVFYLPKLNDYVVHSFHGIGKCIKIERMKISDVEKDYFVIEYKNGDILYLPSEEANTISAYIGSEQQPKLSSLGGAEFARLKERVSASIKQMAISLVEIYNERQKVKGFAFKRDEFLEKQFADSFPYALTVDQQNAIIDVDRDMESDKVMDRLICGDVGFGKTEVALRAIFKCAYNGKQACFVCPTTILSQQHYATLLEGLEPFGVKVEVINRFKTPGQVKEILRRTQEGDIDVLIGTHRVLSSDVIFKDLGLLILDEEQRFGVEHKEKIKDKKRDIDVLTLSATPIPRTLNMSLSGIRDISVIETPPKDRLPIQTYLAPQSDQLIKDVLSRELARGGQAFVVYNRVDSIDEFAIHLKKLLPNARIGVAHGQMSERVLEDVIAKLYQGLYNVLISTTLIENGINLPSANTMVVIEADKLGLGQLYQLRGRIGRSDKLSYAYLTFIKDKNIGEEAYKRLEAIKEFSSLGSGFKIAMRDLEIRGAGNIFGREQHGHIAKVGYDMFVKLLDEKVKEIKGEKVYKPSDVKLEIALSAFISEKYIEDSDKRISYYTRISEIREFEEIKEILSSLENGFGNPPIEIENLCVLAYLRNLSGQYGVKKIRINRQDFFVELEKKEEILVSRLAQNLSAFNGKLAFDKGIKINFAIQNADVKAKVLHLIKFFESIK